MGGLKSIDEFFTFPSMSNPTFRTTKPLPSLRVTRELLEAIEGYVKEQAKELNLEKFDIFDATMEINLTDGLGREQIATVADFKGERFADDTKHIDMSFSTPLLNKSGHFRIAVSLGRTRGNASVTVTATMPDAKKKALSLIDGLFRLLKPYTTNHWMMNPKGLIVLGMIVFIAVATKFSIDATTPWGRFFGASVVGISFSYFLLGDYLRPYVDFDSSAADRSDSRWKWLVNGLATFFVFGTLLVYLRRSIIDF